MEENKNVKAEAEQVAEAKAPVEEVAVEAAPKEEAAAAERGPRDLFYERIRTNFPEGKYDEDEDEYFRNANTRFDALEHDSKQFHDLADKLVKRLGDDPAKAEAVLDWLDGEDMVVAITRHLGPEALSVPEEGSDGYDAWKAAGDARRQEMADIKAKVDEYRKNAEDSAVALDDFAKEAGLDDEQKAAFEKYIAEELLPAIYSGKFTKEMYGLIQHGRNYDADIEGAREQGRVDGRNEQIEVGKKHRQGSGLPNGAAGGNANEEVDRKENSTADWLSHMAQRRK